MGSARLGRLGNVIRGSLSRIAGVQFTGLGGGQRSKSLTAPERDELPVLEPIEARLLMDVSLAGLTWFDPGTHPTAVDNHTPYSLTISNLPTGAGEAYVYWGDGHFDHVQGQNLTDPKILTHDYSGSANHDSWTINVEISGDCDDTSCQKTICNNLPSVAHDSIPWYQLYGDGSNPNNAEAEGILDDLMASNVRYVPIVGCVDYGCPAWSQDAVAWMKGLLNLPKYNTDEFNFKTVLNVNCPDSTFTSGESGDDVVQFTNPYDSNDKTYVWKDWLHLTSGVYEGQTDYWQAAICPNNTQAVGYGNFFDQIADELTWAVPDFLTVDIETFQAPKIVEASRSSDVLNECNVAYNEEEEGYAGYFDALNTCWVQQISTIAKNVNQYIKIVDYRSWNNAFDESTSLTNLNLLGASISVMPQGDYPSPVLYNPCQLETNGVVDHALIDSICDIITDGNSNGIGYPWLNPTGDGTQYTSLSMDQFKEVCNALHDNKALGFNIYTDTDNWDSDRIIPYMRTAAEASSWFHVNNVVSNGGALVAAISVDGVNLGGLQVHVVTNTGSDSELFSASEGATPILIMDGTPPGTESSVTFSVYAGGTMYTSTLTITPPPLICLDPLSGEQGWLPNETLLDNHDANTTLKFDISHGIPGAAVEVYADKVHLIATGTVGGDGTVVVTSTPGYTLVLNDNTITVRQTPVNGLTSADQFYTVKRKPAFASALHLNKGFFTTTVPEDAICQGVIGRLTFDFNVSVEPGDIDVTIETWNEVTKWGNAISVSDHEHGDPLISVTTGNEVVCNLLTYEQSGGYFYGAAKAWYRVTIVLGNESQAWEFARLPGNFNSDTVVNFGDYLVLEQTFNSSGTYCQADGNLSGTVDFIDYLLLEQHFNTTVGLAPPIAPI